MVLHTNRDVYFGGHHPEPADEQLGELKSVMQEEWPETRPRDRWRCGPFRRDG